MGENLDKAIKDVKVAKTDAQALYKSLIDEVASKAKAHDKAKSVYEKSVTDAETATVNLRTAQNSSQPEKQVKKLTDKQKDCMTDVSKYFESYKKAVEVLKAAQKKRDEKVEVMMKK